MDSDFKRVMLLSLASALLVSVLTACSRTPEASSPTPTMHLSATPAVTEAQPAAASSVAVSPTQSPPSTSSATPLSDLTGRIAFSSGPPYAEDIYVVNADGSGQTRLTTDSASDFDPAWS